MRRRAVVELTLVKLREFVREPEAVFWVFVFPVLLAMALGIAFRARPPEEIAVGVVEGAGAAAAAATLDADPGLRARVLPAGEAHDALRVGRLALVIEPGAPPVFVHDPTRDETRVARLLADAALQRAAGRQDAFIAGSRELTEKGSRYIDFVVPGLLGMNLMGTGMWGIGFSIVNARTKRLLKRLVATPMRRSDYLLAQIAGRMVFLVLEVIALLAFARWAFEVPIRGSWIAVAAVAGLGGAAFAGLGLLVASRVQTIEGVSGLMNVVMLPMWLLSGTFFSTSRFPDAVQPFVQALPLTAVNDALRAVLVEGASLGAVAGELGLVAVWGVVSFAAALAIFRWR